MIVYSNNPGDPEKAIYFDNEGHTINYTITYADKSIVFTSERISYFPVFRLIYVQLNNESVDTNFEFSQDGVKFSPYVEGKSRKIN